MSHTLTGVSINPTPHISILPKEEEEISEFSWFQSSLSQTVESADLFDITNSLSVARSKITAKKRRPWFKIGGRSPYLLSLVKDPYRVVEFFLGKECWPNGITEYFPFHIMYSVYPLSFPDIISNLYFAHPQNILLLPTFSTAPQPIVTQSVTLAFAQTPQNQGPKNKRLVKNPKPTALDTEIGPLETIRVECFEEEVLEGEGLADLPLDRIPEHLPPNSPNGSDEPASSLESCLLCLGIDAQVCAIKDESSHIQPQGEPSSKSPQELTLPHLLPASTAVQSEETMPHTFLRKAQRNVNYPGPRRSARVCECHKQDSHMPSQQEKTKNTQHHKNNLLKKPLKQDDPSKKPLL